MSDDLGNYPLKPVASFFGVMIVLAFCGLVAISWDFLPDFEDSDSYSFDLVEEEDLTEDVDSEPERQVLAISIVNYPNKLEHACKQFAAKIKLTNEGEESISYEDAFDVAADYTLTYSLNNGSLRSDQYGFEDYNSWSGQMIGFEDFGTIQPGESKEVTFYGGGIVIQKTFPDGRPAFIHHQNNIFVPGEYSDGQLGANELQLIWVSNLDDDGYYTLYPRSVSESEVMNVELLSDQCDTNAIDRSEPMNN